MAKKNLDINVGTQSRARARQPKWIMSGPPAEVDGNFSSLRPQGTQRGGRTTELVMKTSETTAGFHPNLLRRPWNSPRDPGV